MPRINKDEAVETSSLESLEVKRDAWIKPPPNPEPMVYLEIPDEDENEQTKKNLTSLVFGMKAYSFIENVTMHGVRYIFARESSKLKR